MHRNRTWQIYPTELRTQRNRILITEGGDGSTLDLDFTTGVLDPRLTFTRTTTATYINSSGNVASAAVNEPRFDYSPSIIGQSRGLLIESGAVNRSINSETFTGAIYIPNDTTITVESGDTNPRGTLGSISYAPTTNGDNRFLGPSIAGFTTSAKVTYSIWLKAKGINQGAFLLFCSGALVNSSGVIISQPAGASASFTGNGGVAPTITNLSSTGWTRVAVTTDANFSGVGNFDAFLYPRTTTGQLTTDSLFIWGAQAEQGPGASSYIPTGASVGSRGEDNCSMHDTTLTGSLSWFKNASQGTFFVEATKRFSGTTFAGALFGTEATATKDFMLYQAVGSNFLSFNWGAENIKTYTALSAPFLIKAAVALSPGAPSPDADNMVSINGSNSALNTASNVALPFTSNLFCIGSRGSTGGSVPTQNYADSAIRRIKFFPTAFTAAQLNALTAT